MTTNLQLQSPEDVQAWQVQQARLAAELMGQTYAQCRAAGLNLPEVLYWEHQVVGINPPTPSCVPDEERDRLVLVGTMHDSYTFQWYPHQ